MISFPYGLFAQAASLPLFYELIEEALALGLFVSPFQSYVPGSTKSLPLPDCPSFPTPRWEGPALSCPSFPTGPWHPRMERGLGQGEGQAARVKSVLTLPLP